MRHHTTDEAMVLKHVRRNNSEEIDSLLKEMKLLRNLKHTNILRLLGVVYGNSGNNDSIHLVTEFIECGDLSSNLILNEEVLPWPLRISMAADVVAGMTYLHRHEIVHCDLHSKKSLKLSSFFLSFFILF